LDVLLLSLPARAAVIHQYNTGAAGHAVYYVGVE
jgi:hypothetical protein